jgi:hypothetical protein
VAGGQRRGQGRPRLLQGPVPEAHVVRTQVSWGPMLSFVNISANKLRENFGDFDSEYIVRRKNNHRMLAKTIANLFSKSGENRRKL